MAIINYIERHLKTFSVKAHKHYYWEIIYITEGQGCIETENHQFIEYKKGEIVCIPSNLNHVNHSTVGFKNIHFTIENWVPPFSTPILIPFSDLNKHFYAILKLTYQYFHQLPANHPINLSLTTCIEAFLNTMIHQSKDHNITQVIVNEIIERYNDSTFDLDQAYQLVPLSKEYLRKIFIKEYGISPSKFLQQKRLTLAKQLLSQKIDGYSRINEIAESSGFNDLAYFCRIFKKETGVSPNQYRLELLKENKVYTPDFST